MAPINKLVTHQQSGRSLPINNLVLVVPLIMKLMLELYGAPMC
jgi:hypothetical protein